VRIRVLIGTGAVLAATCCEAQQTVLGPRVDSPAGAQAPGGAVPDNAIPLTPDMIRDLGRRFGETKRAQEEAATQVAVPVNRRVSVTYTPGQATNIIQTVKGYPTALSFFDATGQPWPIAWDTNSNPAGLAGGSNCSSSQSAGGPAVAAVGFYVCTPVKGSNVLQIAPASLQPRGGLLVTLQGAPKPISFLLIGGGERYDADVSVQVADRGPNAKVQIITRPNAPETGAAYLTAMLDGVPPAEATPLMVSGVSPEELRAWRLGDRMFLRTRLTLLSPEWTASENGEGGLTVYSVPATPVVLLSERGRTVSASLSEP
jgi:intracellular multiplication protein IcmK